MHPARSTPFLPLPCIIVLGLLMHAAVFADAVAPAYAVSWNHIDSLDHLGLTTSALAAVESVYQTAKRLGNTDNVVRALLYEARLVSERDEDAAVKTIGRFEGEIPETKGPTASILHSIAGDLYWMYYQANVQRFRERTPVPDSLSRDLASWDLSRIMDAALRHYEASIADADTLKAARLADYKSLLSDSGCCDKRRPTLYDFLSHRYIDFLTAQQFPFLRPLHVFPLDSAAYFSDYDTFARLPLATGDSLSFPCRALKILQKLIVFHESDGNIDALIDADFARLDFVRTFSTLENRERLYAAALRRLAERVRQSPEAADVIWKIVDGDIHASLQYRPGIDTANRWLRREAVAYCDTAAARYGDAFWAHECTIYKAWILVGRLKFETEKVAAPNRPFCTLLKWNDIDGATFRIVPLRDSVETPDAWGRFGVAADSILPWLKTHPPVAQWSLVLPNSGDHQIHTAEVAMPPLPVGSYAIVVCTDSTFSAPRAALAAGSIRISSISYMARKQKDRSCELYVRDRETGKPLRDAVVKELRREETGEKGRGGYTTEWIDTADGDGRVVVPADSDEHRWVESALEIIAGNDRLFGDGRVLAGVTPGGSRAGQRATRATTAFFTDRFIYRPGQTISFTGIVLQRDGDTDAVVPHQKEKVTLFDRNSQPVASLDCISNDFGSISGTFVAPLRGLPGVMRIKGVPDGGQAQFTVEEYKRPKFEVTLDPVKGQFRLDEPVIMTGRVQAYAGSPIDHAVVTYTVTRSGLRPGWSSRFTQDGPSGGMKIIARDSMRTDDSGGFRIAFDALPDLPLPEAENPAFDYTVMVRVTDAGGETRWASSRVSVGYRALDLRVMVPRNVDKVRDTAFPIRALTRNGLPTSAAGTIRIFRLKGPDRAVRERPWQRPDTTVMEDRAFHAACPGFPCGGEDSIVTWPRERMVQETKFDTRTDSTLSLRKAEHWPQGMYAVDAASTDTFGREVHSTQYFLLYSDRNGAAAAPLGDIFIPVKDSGQPGDKAAFILGSAYPGVEALFEVMHNGEVVRKEWLRLSESQKLVEIPIEERFRGNVDVHFAFIRNGACYTHDALVTVPWKSKKLSLSLATFRDKLHPGRNEEWRIKIRGPGGEKVAAEMAADLYDASLDALRPYSWEFRPWCHRASGILTGTQCAPFGGKNSTLKRDPDPIFADRSLPCSPGLNLFGFTGSQWERRGEVNNATPVSGGGGGFISGGTGGGDPGDMTFEKKAMAEAPTGEVLSGMNSDDSTAATLPDAREAALLAAVHARTNLEETAFFYPQLTTNDSGEVVVSFTVPDALTRWKLLCLAHTKSLEYGLLEKSAVTQKPLMVMPALPRFLREGDRVSLAATIVNLSDSSLSGSARLTLLDALTLQPIDSAFCNADVVHPFTIPKGRSAPCVWEIRVPEGAGPVIVRMVVAAGDATDGEDDPLPVVTDRALVTETLPLPVNGSGVRKFTFQKLLASGGASASLRNHRLTLEFAQNPAWYAVAALPGLLEGGNDNSEGLFARFYAATVASAIVNSSPKIKAVFDAWKSRGADALLSNLDKNRELKGALVEETPWVLEGKSETGRKHRVGELFDLNRIANERSSSLDNLQKMQIRESGAWPWFPGLGPDRYLTQSIVTGLGRLHHLGMLDPDASGHRAGRAEQLHPMIERGLSYLDARIREDYDTVMKHVDPDSDHLSQEQIQYLYARSFFPDDTFTDSNRVACRYYSRQAATYWRRCNRSLQGMIALALHRRGDTQVPLQIIESLRENALHGDESGMYWKEMTGGCSRYDAPLSAQVLAIEAFDEVAHDSAAVERMKLWLLKNKQTTDWGTSPATTEACYALLLRGSDLLSTKNGIAVTLGPVTVDPAKPPRDSVEAGTGYFTASWSGPEVVPAMGRVTVAKTTPGTAWGAMYWQYFEDLDKVTPAASPLALTRRLFVKRSTDGGAALDPLADGNTVKVGDRVTVRIELTVDRALDYVHLKDCRAAGFEPLEALSGCKWQDGLSYYESPRDLSTGFFFSHIGKGHYVFEYDVVAAHAGEFSEGFASVRCMYAPEFAAHSEGMRIQVKSEK